MEEKFKNLLSTVLNNEVEFELELEESDFGASSVIKITADSDDLGKIIGKGGSTARGLRELIYIYNKINNTNYSLEINENTTGEESE